MLTSLTAALAVVLVSCADPEEHAEFRAGDTGALSECMAAQFPFEPTFLAARNRDGGTGIFLQTTSDVNYRNDVVLFQFYETEHLEPGTSLVLGENTGADRVARGKMVFLSSCPDSAETLELAGTLEFDSFDLSPGGVVEGEFTGRALKARTDEVVVDDLTGSWRFVVRQGPPYEDFYGLPEGW